MKHPFLDVSERGCTVDRIIPIVIYFLLSLLFLSVPIYFVLKSGQKLPSLGRLVFWFLFGPLLHGILPLLLLIPFPSAHPMGLIYPRLERRRGKTATQLLLEIQSRGASIGGIWPWFSIKFHLGAMELNGMARREQVTIREFSDQFEREKPEERHYESWEILDQGEIRTGLVWLYYQGSILNPNQQRFWAFPLLVLRGA